jgi:L-fuculose-phosphate aldolase
MITTSDRKVPSPIFESETALRESIVRVTRLIAEQGLANSSDGNITARLDQTRLLVTPAGMYKRWMQPADLLITDLEGCVLQGKPNARPTSELLLHLEVYRQRMDIQASIHAHPPFATALTVAGMPFPIDIIPEVLGALGEVPTAPYATPGTPDMATSIRETIKTHQTLLLSHHGSLTVGQSLEEALIALERLEHTARVYAYARILGEPTPIPAEELAKLRP